jgi:hypothetical protein
VYGVALVIKILNQKQTELDKDQKLRPAQVYNVTKHFFSGLTQNLAQGTFDSINCQASNPLGKVSTIDSHILIRNFL